jgi:hypothetical protein
MKGARAHRAVGAPQDGYVLLLMLFLCCAVAVTVQALCTVVLCTEGALYDESVGRQRLAEKDSGLAALRALEAQAWVDRTWMDVVEEPVEVAGSVTRLEDGDEWVLMATVRQGRESSRLVASALLERGRDGIDLPMAALVGERVTVTDGRASTCVEMPAGQGEAAAHLCRSPDIALLGPGIIPIALGRSWRLDEGWRYLAAAAPGEGAVPGSGVTVITGRPGQRIELPSGSRGSTAEDPILVVVTGGADLQAEHAGDLYGVLVVDDGCLFLEGTTIHGAVFASETVDFGVSGRLIFESPILRWASDRSLVRVRLVPGTRWEGTE